MKLWQKVFLCTLALVLLAIDVTAIAVTLNYHNMMLQREKAKAVSEHTFISASITNHILYQRLEQGAVLLTQDKVYATLRRLVSEQAESGTGLAVYQGSQLVHSSAVSVLEQETAYRGQVQQSSDCLVKIAEHDRRTYTIAGSSIQLEGYRYDLYTVTDCSDVYQLLDQQLAFVQAAGILSAAVTGAVLIVIVFRLLSPLHQVNRTIGQIAQGNYELRIREQGSREFRELSQNINRMAEAVEENVAGIQRVSNGRKRFIDNFSHEMKTPLTSILGFGDILRVKRTVTEAQRQEYAGIIVEETKRLQRMSGKLLEFATSESAPLEFATLFLPTVFKEVQATIRPALAHQEIALVCHAQSAYVLADKELFLSLLYNLIDNAAKASSAGQTVSLTCLTEGTTVLVRVEDAGIGIRQEELDKITEPFYMVDKSRGRKAGGSGLGLSLCLQIARRHGAHLSFSSTPGRGTTVTLEFPCGKEAASYEEE